MSALLAACRPCNATDADPRLAHLPFEGDAACCFRVSRQLLRFSTLMVAIADEITKDIDFQCSSVELVRLAAPCARGAAAVCPRVLCKAVPKLQPLATPKPCRIARAVAVHPAVTAIKLEDEQWIEVEGMIPN